LKRSIVFLFALGLVLGVTSVPAEADSTGLIVIQTINNRKDDNGWARDTFTRTSEIKGSGNKYTVTITDTGKFQTVKGEPSPNAGVPISRSLPGVFSGTGVFKVKGHLISDKKIQDLPDAFDDTNGTQITTGNWWKQFFGKKATSTGIKDWKWSYSTDDEKMVQAEGFPISGDITGKLSSHLIGKFKCRVSKADKRTVWTVTNVKGDRSRDFKAWVMYAGKYSPTQYGTVAAGKSVEITTPYGGRLSVWSWDGYGKRLKNYSWSKASITCA
jgi:hypothetical protein